MILPDPTEVVCWSCGTCKKVYLTKEAAVSCCLCLDCKKEKKQFDTPHLCESCCSLRDLKNFLKKIRTWTTTEHQGFFDLYSDKYFADWEDVQEYLAGLGEDEDLVPDPVPLRLVHAVSCSDIEIDISDRLEYDPEHEIRFSDEDLAELENINERAYDWLKKHNTFLMPGKFAVSEDEILENIDEELREKFVLEKLDLDGSVA